MVICAVSITREHNNIIEFIQTFHITSTIILHEYIAKYMHWIRVNLMLEWIRNIIYTPAAGIISKKHT